MESDRPQLLELRLRNYRSVPGAILRFTPLTVLVGPNGAGKSNILDALSLLSDAMSLQLRTALDARGGIKAVRLRWPGTRRAPRFRVAVRLRVPVGSAISEAHYGFEARAVADHGYVISRERCHIQVSSTDPFWFDRTEAETRSGPLPIMANPNRIEAHALLLPMLSGLPDFAEVRNALASIRRYSISPHVIRDLHDPTPGQELMPDGRNVASVVAEMQQSRPEDYERLCEFMGRVVPGITRVESVQYGPKRGLRFTQKVGPSGKPLTLEAASMSDGTLRVLGILTAVFQRHRPTLMAIEEPEATIHPGALGVLMDILRQGQDRSQILITTHSPDVLDTPDLDPDAVRLVQWQGVTSVSPIGPASRMWTCFRRSRRRPHEAEADLHCGGARRGDSDAGSPAQTASAPSDL